jgi:competence protein ComEC
MPPAIAFPALPSLGLQARIHKMVEAMERWLEAERDQLPLWLPVALGLGVILWELAGREVAFSVALATIAASLVAWAIGLQSRLGRAVFVGAISVAIGYGAISLRSAYVAAPVLGKVWVGEFYGRVERVEWLTARDTLRLTLATDGHQGLPRRIRLNMPKAEHVDDIRAGAVVLTRARLMPPAGPTLPGGYDFARRAWFAGIGATGSALGPVVVHKPSSDAGGLAELRSMLSEHIREQMPGSAGAIGAALVTGDQGAIPESDAQAMRDSGLAHLLSISGLHVTAVVGFIFLLCSRLLALCPPLALRFPIPIMAAAAAAVGAVAYTLLAGSEVPTVRSCIAALLVLLALAVGRDPLTLRLVAAGALIVLLLWPEALAGPSFQLSFAAVATIVILHDSRWMRRWTERREEGLPARLGRGLISIVLTGIAIEIILSPIALYHFHRAGLYGALANVVAIPLTTFVIMPAEALALLLDLAGIGAPFWWLAGTGIEAMLTMASYFSSLPGAVATLPSMPDWAFACMIAGGLVLGLLKTRLRWLGAVPFFAGFVAMIFAPRPDLLVTGDGKHLAIVSAQGDVAFLRARAGDYVRDMLLEKAGTAAEPEPIERWPGAKCSADICVIELVRRGRPWHIMATRSPYPVPAMEMAAACKRVDIVISDRWLPASCRPRWLKADRNMLELTGGLALYLAGPKIETVYDDKSHLPWVTEAQAAKLRSAPAQ